MADTECTPDTVPSCEDISRERAILPLQGTSFRFIKVHYGHPGPRKTFSAGQVPKILLQGKWLKAAGFEIGKTMCVSVEKGTIVLRALQDPSPVPPPKRVPARRVFHVQTIHEPSLPAATPAESASRVNWEERYRNLCSRL